MAMLAAVRGDAYSGGLGGVLLRAGLLMYHYRRVAFEPRPIAAAPKRILMSVG